MNNTQQAGETAKCTCREDQKQRPLCPVCDKQEYDQLQTAIGAKKASTPDVVEAKASVSQKAIAHVVEFCKPVYYHGEACHKAACLSFFAGHAEGAKDAVGFAEWASGQGWKFDSQYAQWQSVNPFTVKTTAELHTLYKNQK